VLEPRRSATLAVILLVAHLGAAAIMVSLPLAWVWKAVLWIVLAVSLWRELACHGWLRGKRQIVQLILEEDDRCVIADRDGRQGGHIASAVVHPWTIFLRVQREETQPVCSWFDRLTANGPLAGERKLVLWCDSLPADDFRRARARLRLRNPAA
jgi:hypothetical protein